jgi:hypothetical protein
MEGGATVSIHYKLVENKIASSPGVFRAIVQPTRKTGLEDVIKEVLKRGSTVNEADVRSVMTDFVDAIVDMMIEGAFISMPVANFRCGIRGNFDGPDDGYDPARHQVAAYVLPGIRIRRAFQTGVQVIKEESFDLDPKPEVYTDVHSGTQDNLLTPGGLGRLVGRRLKFDPADPDQGIFFLAEDGSATPVAFVGKNMPAELFFTVPTLAVGEYVLEVRAVPRDASELRCGRLKAMLTVT